MPIILTLPERSPSFYDYFAAAILANGMALMWDYVLLTLPALVLLSIPVYIGAGFVASYLVCKRTSKNHLMVGFKTAFAASLMSILMIGSVAMEINVGTIFLLMICYFVGGTIAAYLTLRKQLRKVDTKIEEKPSLNS